MRKISESRSSGTVCLGDFMLVRSLLAGALLGLAASSASAQVIHVDFTGNLNILYYGNQTGAFTGHFSYNAASLTHDSDGNFTAATVDFGVDSPILDSLYGVGNKPGGSGEVTYQSDWQGSGVDHMSFTFSFSGSPYSQFTVDLNYPLGTFGDDSHLPTSIPNFEMPGASNNIAFSDTYGDLTFGHLTGITSIVRPSLPPPPPSVPEPASWAMMLAGFGAIGATMRRRRVAIRFA